MNRPEATESLYTQVTQMWYTYLRRLLQTRVVFSDMDAILGKKDDETEEESTDASKLGKASTKIFPFSRNDVDRHFQIWRPKPKRRIRCRLC